MAISKRLCRRPGKRVSRSRRALSVISCACGRRPALQLGRAIPFHSRRRWRGAARHRRARLFPAAARPFWRHGGADRGAQRALHPAAGRARRRDGSGACNPGMSSWAAFTERARLKPGETVLVNGATGASGRLAVQIARHLGAGRVIATGRNSARWKRSPRSARTRSSCSSMTRTRWKPASRRSSRKGWTWSSTISGA